MIQIYYLIIKNHTENRKRNVLRTSNDRINLSAHCYVWKSSEKSIY